METSKKLFTVQVTYEIIVVASDAAAAERHATAEHVVDFGEPDVLAVPMSFLPADWDEDSIPFGDSDPAEPDRTIDGWMKLGAAPDYEALRKKFGKSGSEVE